MQKPLIHVYTDGACSGNPGPGGWAALILENSDEAILQGHAPNTTNNRMELMAVLEALRFLIQKDKNEHCIHLFTDSRYVKDGMTVWRHNWKRNGWQTSQKKPVKNRDLWEKLDHLTESLTLEWHWVKAHSAHPENERVDGLARAQSLM